MAGDQSGPDQSGPEQSPRDDGRRSDDGILVSPRYLGPAPDSPSSLSSFLSPPPRSALSKPVLGMRNLELLHNFTTATYATLTTDGGLQELWQMAVPRIAFSYDFVMHALLAMSALHLSFLHPSDRSYYMMATEHHGKALRLLRAAFPAKDPSHGTAIFAASSLVGLYVCGCQLDDEDMSLKAPTWIRQFRGIWATAQWRWKWVLEGELGSMLAPKPADQSRYAGEDTVFPSSLLALSQRGAPGQLDPEELENDDVHQIYIHATEVLKASWDRSWLTELRLTEVLHWPVNIKERFLDFIEERRPRALVLLAHHCALMESVDKRFWWIKGRGMDEVARIDNILEERWKRWLDWPRRRCNPG